MKQLQPAVRDLVGAIAAPGLLSAQMLPPVVTDAECAKLLAAHNEAILRLDRDPEPLIRWLEASNGGVQLGRYFEALLGFWISELMKAPLYEASIKVVRERAVVGELDFVFQLPGAQIEHWEAAVKFYLCTAQDDAGARQASSYIGTMTKDRLDLKIRKIFDQQLFMSQAPEAMESIRAAGFVGPIERRALVKGALFYPIQSDWRKHPHPPEVASGHLRGWWSHLFPQIFGTDSRWAVLGRRRWLSPFFASEREFVPLTLSEVTVACERELLETRRAIMVARLERVDGAWIERERGLVVHPGWPWRVIED